MPREVFADEIEAFLQRLDVVAAARVVANEAGQIERIYVTSESIRDDGAIRREITSALMSRFSLPLDGWRVQIAHLEPEIDVEMLPECRLIRLQETITETTTRVTVDLRYERDGVHKTLTGSAQAPPGQVHRLRTVALATLDAVRPLVDRSGSRTSLEALTLMPFAGATVALAAVALTSDRALILQVGAETVVGNEAEAVVGGVLDAVRKATRPLVQMAAEPADRRRQFDGLRRHYERLIRTGGASAASGASAGQDAESLDDAAPLTAPPPPPSGAPSPTQSGAATEPAAPSGPDYPESDHRPDQGGPPVSGAGHHDMRDPDLVLDMSEIRPEREGGAAIVREEIRHDAGASAKPGPRLSIEDTFYRRLVTSGVPVHIRCRDGYEIPTAIVRDFGTYSLMVEINGLQELVFKHGIISIRPYGPLPPEHITPS